MNYLLFFYFLFIISNYIKFGKFNVVNISLLLSSYAAFLFYFYRFMKKDHFKELNVRDISMLSFCIFFMGLGFYIRYLLFEVRDGMPLLSQILPFSILTLITLSLISRIFDLKNFLNRRYFLLINIGLLLVNLILIYMTKDQRIDVFYFLRDGAHQLLTLQNPYDFNYPQIYTPEEVKLYYYPDPVFLKYVPYQTYLPLPLLLSSFGYIFGDVRVTIAIMIFIIPFLVRGILTKAYPTLDKGLREQLSIIPILYPSLIQIILNSWNDVGCSFFLILFVFSYLNKKVLLQFISLACLIAVKQYSVIYILPFLFIIDLKNWRLYLVMFTVVAVPILIYAIWDIKHFMDGVVALQLKQPFRPESKSLASFFQNYFNISIHGLRTFLGILGISTTIGLICAILKKRTATNDLSRIKFVIFIACFLFFNFLMFSKQSFTNYYFFLGTMLYLAIILSHRSFVEAKIDQLNAGGRDHL